MSVGLSRVTVQKNVRYCQSVKKVYPNQEHRRYGPPGSVQPFQATDMDVVDEPSALAAHRGYVRKIISYQKGKERIRGISSDNICGFGHNPCDARHR
jgi:hypothetical protein